MSGPRKSLTSEEAAAYTATLERRANALGVDLDHWILAPGKANDIRLGKGPRHAIVTFAQDRAAHSATYGSVLGMTVIQGDGTRYKIRTHDLAGFVCANGYCTIAPPGAVAALPVKSRQEAPVATNQVVQAKPKTQARLLPRPLEIVPRVEPGIEFTPFPALKEALASAYRCSCFDGVCATMRWDPANGHIPRGFLGATGKPSDVELVLVFSEPGDPQPGDHTTMEEALRHAHGAFGCGNGLFHKNARKLFQLCWPDLPFEQQLKRVWLTESVLCSALVPAGPVPKPIERECGERFLRRQLALMPDAMVVALGGKAQERLERLGVTHMKAHALAPPGCNQAAAFPSWVRVAEALAARRS